MQAQTDTVGSNRNNPTDRWVPLAIGLCAVAVFHLTVVLAGGWQHYTGTAWDEGYYVWLAVRGYELGGAGNDFTVYSNLPFAPGYAMLLRFFAWATGASPEVVRHFVSAALFLVGCAGLGRLFASISKDRARNHLALAATVFWPGSFYFLTGYAEALYFPLAVWCLVALVERRYLYAAVLAALALFTRSPAIILAGTIGFVLAARWLREPGARAATLGRLAYCMPICATGLLGYLLFLWHDVGDPFAFLAAYDAWLPVRHDGFDNLTMEGVFRAGLIYGDQPSVLLAAFAFLSVPPILILRRQALPFELQAFCWIGWGFLLTQMRWQEPFVDMLRWCAILFPVHYCVVSSQRSRWHAPLLLLPSIALYVTMVVLFVNRAWVS